MLAHFSTREINLLAFAIRAGYVALRRNIGHRAAERRMERVGVDREKDDLFFWHAALDCMTKNGVRQIPAQMDADHRIVTVSIADVDGVKDCLIVHVAGATSDIVLYNNGSSFQWTAPK